MDVSAEVEELHPADDKLIVMPSIIEFAGLPGVGKSTIAAQLASALELRGVRVKSRTHIAADDALFAFRHLRRGFLIFSQLLRSARLYRQSAIYVFAESDSQWGDVFKLCWNFWTVIALVSAWRRQASNDVLILDQGIFQAVLSTHVGGRRLISKERLKNLLSQIDLGGMSFIFVKASPATSQSRLRNRSGAKSRMQKKKWIDDKDLWIRAEQLLDQLETMANDPIKVSSSDQRTPESIVGEILQQLHTP